MGEGVEDLLRQCGSLVISETGGEEDGFQVPVGGVRIIVHDEIVVEVPNSKDYTAQTLEDVMNEVPEWAKGFPIDSKGFETIRYRKD